MPHETCNDKKCPFHGQLKVRGRMFTGTVVSRDVHHSATIEMQRKKYIKKFERYEMRRTKLHVHNPPCLNAAIGEIVVIIESKPISKTKKFVVIKKIGDDLRYKEKTEALLSDLAAQTALHPKQQLKEERD